MEPPRCGAARRRPDVTGRPAVATAPAPRARRRDGRVRRARRRPNPQPCRIGHDDPAEAELHQPFVLQRAQPLVQPLARHADHRREVRLRQHQLDRAVEAAIPAGALGHVGDPHPQHAVERQAGQLAEVAHQLREQLEQEGREQAEAARVLVDETLELRAGQQHRLRRRVGDHRHVGGPRRPETSRTRRTRTPVRRRARPSRARSRSGSGSGPGRTAPRPARAGARPPAGRTRRGGRCGSSSGGRRRPEERSAAC